MKTLKAPAKLNLYLEVTSKRDNGYHELDSEVVFLDLADEISIEKSTDLIVEGTNFPDEIVLRTANLMAGEFGVSAGAKLRITKNIPSGGGLGGGSADAAAAIILLRNFWAIDCSDAELYKLALKLGADVPACLYHQLTGKTSVHFSGIGEVLNEIEQANNLHFVLVNPNQSLATNNVFENFTFTENTEPKTNHLQTSAIKLMPEIGKILNTLEDQSPQLARMTGSGATCFGVFENEELAQKAASSISAEFPKWWVRNAKSLAV